MKLDSKRRVPAVVLCLLASVVGAPFLLVAFALSPLSDTWIKFVVPALPLTGLVALWFWTQRPNPGGPNMPVGALEQKAYPPGA